MSRYIDADALLERLPDDLPYKSSVKRVLTQATTADVVPKEERDGWKKLAQEYQWKLDEAYKQLETAKGEKK